MHRTLKRYVPAGALCRAVRQRRGVGVSVAVGVYARQTMWLAQAGERFFGGEGGPRSTRLSIR